MKKKELFLYLIFGGLTTIVNIVSYMLLTNLQIEYRLATSLAWIISIIFAFITNKKYVFESKQTSLLSVLKESFSFVLVRILSLLIDLGAMIIMIEYMKIDDMLSKLISNVIVVIVNYIASKYLIFKKR